MTATLRAYRLVSMTLSPQDVQATYCATLVDEWVERGVSCAVVAPGSRSTPMALAIAERPEIATHVVHDERSAAFVALGAGVDGIPALLLCTSGTAAANFFPAVVEAGLSEVPMIVLTADRPEELRGVGAPQTIDQLHLYGGHVRWFGDPGVPTEDQAPTWRALASEVWTSAQAGPVQLNLAFREPLLGSAATLPERSEPVVVSGTSEGPGHTADANAVGAAATGPAAVGLPTIDAVRGVILVGGRSGVAAADVAELRERTGWPIVADPLSEMRHLDGAITTADALLRHAGFAERQLPDVIVRIGRPAASKVLAQWCHRATQAGATLFQVGGPGVIDPDHDVTAAVTMADVLDVAPDRRSTVGTDVPTGTATAWQAGWEHADAVADATIVTALRGFDEITEPLVARTVAEHAPPGVRLVVASSMPVRDLEWFGGATARAHANRGANGIDGVVSTALGIALGGGPTVALLGDLAFVHDSSALVGLSHRGADLRIVVVDNDGGGIFSFLPQASSLDHDRFEQLFGTPLGVDIVALAAAHGLESRSVETVDELRAQLAVPGPWVACVPSDRPRNVAVHDAIHAAVVAAIDSESA
jgi:2-succinyl-5-enolpyruvyl-6-hydroxy-3-cyclohexene-1-carboxylate synthase